MSAVHTHVAIGSPKLQRRVELLVKTMRKRGMSYYDVAIALDVFLAIDFSRHQIKAIEEGTAWKHGLAK